MLHRDFSAAMIVVIAASIIAGCAKNGTSVSPVSYPFSEMKHLTVSLIINASYFYHYANSSGTTRDTAYSGVFMGGDSTIPDSIALVWNGDRFSETYITTVTFPYAEYSFSGKVAADGKSLAVLEWHSLVVTGQNKVLRDTSRFELVNVPLTPTSQGDSIICRLTGSALGGLIANCHYGASFIRPTVEWEYTSMTAWRIDSDAKLSVAFSR